MHSESTSIYSQPILIHTHLNPMNWHCRYPPPHQRITSPRRTMRCAHIVLTHTNLMENPSNYTMNAQAAKQQPQRTIRHSRLSTAAFFYIFFHNRRRRWRAVWHLTVSSRNAKCAQQISNATTPQQTSSCLALSFCGGTISGRQSAEHCQVDGRIVVIFHIHSVLCWKIEEICT